MVRCRWEREGVKDGCYNLLLAAAAKLQTVVYDILPSRRQVPESGVRSVSSSMSVVGPLSYRISQVGPPA